MSDKAKDQLDNNDEHEFDEHEFSLNNVDLSDDESISKDSHASAILNVPIEEKEVMDLDFEAAKQAPSVPVWLESTQADINTEMTTEINPDAKNKQDDAYSSVPCAEAVDTTSEPDILATDSSSPEQVQPTSNNKSIFVWIGIASVIAVSVFFFISSNSTAPEHHKADTAYSQQGKLSNDTQQQHLQTQISSLQVRIASMQTRLIAKNREIAELTHQLSEQTRSQPQTKHTRKPVVQRITPTVKRKAAAPQAVVTPLRQQATGATWGVIIASVNSRAAAEKALVRLKSKGIIADIRPTVVKGKNWFRVRVSGFSSRAEAEVQQKYLAQQHGIKATWVHQQK